MIRKVQECLSDIKDPKQKEHYTQLIITLLEKGYFPGLAGVPVVKSGISHIDGENGILTYRGYPVQELAEHCSYEDVCFLLLNGDLPLQEERKEIRTELLKHKDVDEKIGKVVAAMDEDLHPMYMLSAGVLLLQSTDPGCFDVDNYHNNLQRGIRLISKFPTILGIYRSRDPYFGKDKNFESYAQYSLYCFNQQLAENKEWVDIFQKILILHADHTMNNSTFSVRAVGSSKASIYASISSAINSLSGPLHGGANERVIRMLEEIGSPERVEDYVDQKLENKEKIMGIGHRVYKTYDPRSLFMKNQILPLVFEEKLGPVDEELKNLYNIAIRVEEVVLDRLSGKKLYPNVDFWSGLVLKAMGIDPTYFTTIFALGRVMGWSAHWIEHMEVKNRIFRPFQLYDGVNDRHILLDPDEEIASSSNKK
jgi:citrate synthase